ncbi:protein FAM171A2 isoform X1 [Hippoglossus hippoglossus]|uniref:protein FAM171A2 isoform X1 n=1 Tax=Hippoglossus hippoglossus TaxID=8267 RepID=UPI00148C3FDF|nr:protein FAM171A2 isoform X1 [Hippoglossus hippoglossus]
MTDPRISRLLLFVWMCALWDALAAKSLPDPGGFEVEIKVQVFDSSDLSPLAGAQVHVHGNQTILASSRAGSDGVLKVNFLYRAGTWVIITASKQDYITNSVPWHSSRIPLYASVSLYLLVQRPGTLILYDDVLQVLSGSPGARNQPLVQLQRKSLQLPSSSNYTALSAAMTTARSQYEIGGFPFLLGQETNSSGAETGWTDLTAVAVVSIQLLDKDGTAIQVSDPIQISVPLPSDTRYRMAMSVPAWMYQPKTGLWVRNGTGYIEKEGAQFVWNVLVPQMGYWLAAFPSSSGLGLSHPGLRDITTYHTLFLLCILGSLALLVLILLCVLLYYCRCGERRRRRKCLKPRRQQGKPHATNLNGAKRDQGTSTSRLNLICGGHAESGPSNDKSDLSPSRNCQSSREDLTKHVPAHMLRHAKGKNAPGAQRGESFPMKVTRATETNNLDNPLLHEEYNRSYSPMEGKESEYHRHHNANDNRGYASDPPSPPRFQGYVPSQSDKPPEYSASAADNLARPTSLNTQAGQIIFCSSIDQMKENMYRSMVPTLVIPAHYMRLPSEFSGKDGKDQKDQDNDGAQMGGGQQHHHHSQKQGQQQGGSQGDDSEEPSWASDSSGGPMTIPVLFNDSTMAQMNGELQALTEKKLLELGVKQHPRAWFISLDGRANAHVRHSFIDPGNDLSGGGFGGGSSSAQRDINLEASLDDRRSALNRKGKDERWGTGGRKGHGVSSTGKKSYSKLAYPDHSEPSSSSEGRPVSPEENSLTPLLDEGPSSRGSTIPRRGRSRVNSARSSNSENRRDSMTSPEDDPDDKDENKKSPWQKIEDRPLMVFHPRK